MYYKLVTANNELVDVSENPIFVEYQESNSTMIRTEDNPQGIVSSKGDTIFRLDTAVGKFPQGYITVTFTEITETEYNRLLTEVVNETYDDSDIESVRNSVINQLSKACNLAIVSGFDMVMDNDTTVHFSLTSQDQSDIDMLEKSAMIDLGFYPYHADKDDCIYLSKKEVFSLAYFKMQTVTQFTTYYNSLRKYVLSIDDIDVLRIISWGTEVPEEYWTIPYRDLINNSYPSLFDYLAKVEL